MTIGNALTFIDRGLEDLELRKCLNAVADPAELQMALMNEKRMFSTHDFDEAYHHRLNQCHYIYG